MTPDYRLLTCEPGSATSVPAISTIAQGMYVTLWYFVQTFRRKAFTQHFEYPERPVPVTAALPRLPPLRPDDLHRLRQVRRACPVDCIYIEKEKTPPPARASCVTGFKIDYTKCMFCALCVDPCPVDCIFMGSTYDLSCFSRDGCVVDYAKLPLEVAWGQATLNPTAVHESKLVSLPVWTKPPRPGQRQRESNTAAVRRTLGRPLTLTGAIAHDRPRPLILIFVAAGVDASGRRTWCSASSSARTSRRRRRATIYECGEPTDRQRLDSVRPAVLRRRAAVRDLRRGDGVLLPVGGGVRQRATGPRTNEACRRVRVEAAKDLQPARRADEPVEPPSRSRRTPSATAKSLAWLAFADILVFFGVLLVGFAYLWRRGDLDWVRSMAAAARRTAVQSPTAAIRSAGRTARLRRSAIRSEACDGMA